MSKRKLIVAYLILVGLPLLALLAILRGGERLTPPVSVGGAWNIDADFSALASTACKNLMLGVKQPLLSISQSGPSLALTFNNSQRTTLAGTINDTKLSTEPEHSDASTVGNCVDPRAIRVVAQVAKQAGQRILTGTLSLMDCAECAPIRFRATRQAPKADEGR